MSRKNIVYNFKPLVDGDMSLASMTGEISTVSQFDTVTYEATWTGGQATNGTIDIEYSKDGLIWHNLDFGATIGTIGASDTHRMVIIEIGFKFTRPKYTRTNISASGVINFSVFCTNKGA